MRAIDADVMLAELKPIDYEAGHRTVLISDVAKIMREWVERQPTLTPAERVGERGRGVAGCRERGSPFLHNS